MQIQIKIISPEVDALALTKEGLEEITVAVAAFNKANAGRTMYWMVDEKRAVRVKERSGGGNGET